MIIKGMEKIIKDYKYNLTSIFIVYNMQCNDNYEELTTEEKNKILNYIYEFYMKDETHLDIGFISDIIMNNYKMILAKNYTIQELNNLIYSNI